VGEGQRWRGGPCVSVFPMGVVSVRGRMEGSGGVVVIWCLCGGVAGGYSLEWMVVMHSEIGEHLCTPPGPAHCLVLISFCFMPAQPDPPTISAPLPSRPGSGHPPEPDHQLPTHQLAQLCLRAILQRPAFAAPPRVAVALLARVIVVYSSVAHFAGFGVHEAIQAVAARARELVAGAAQASRHLALRAAVADGVCHMSSSAEARPWRSVGLGMCPSAEPQGFVGRMQGAPREGGGQQLAGHLSAAAVHKAKGGLALRARAVCTARALHAALGALQGSGRTGPPLSWCGTPEHGGPAMQQACLAMPGSTALPACTAVQA
jgi:hypothetical protein